ncbi:MAG: beta-hydroxyacyl-ACP dehydratase [Rhodopirellula sp.]|nr:beta-hydroxyacyl-ACP dehydratase [Rhodopirellula sp.]
MSKKDLILDPSQYDVNTVVADIEEIRRYNPQRHEMEQLTAICHEDRQRNICVGYKDLGPDEFWVRGHMPGVPIMPGVVMCEAAAQLASYCARKFKLMDAEMIGFGGLKDVRFRGIVRPGERFVIAVNLLRARRAMLIAQFQCFVRGEMVCDGIVLGIPFSADLLKGAES